MICEECTVKPSSFTFDVAIAAVGYERRCRYVVEQHDVSAIRLIGFEFGFLKEASYADNHAYFASRNWELLSAQDQESFHTLTRAVIDTGASDKPTRVFLDISSMSREMMANITLALDAAQDHRHIELFVAYVPVQFGVSYKSAPIRLAAPVKPQLAGWSSRPDKPLGVIMGLGCEPGLALGALQVLEPNKAWLHSPRGFDTRFAAALTPANQHIADIFDVTEFDYEIAEPDLTRGRIEALLNSLEGSFRLICIPFGPKLYAWLILATVILSKRREIGVWSFSSREHVDVIDREVSGKIVWYRALLVSPGSRD